MVSETTQHYRWDFVGLSTDEKPTPETSEKVVNGSTFYCSDTSKLYVFCDNNWYERKPLGGGGTTYTAGTGIDITNNTISVNTTTIQEKLTAGTGINISDNTVSADTTTLQEKLTAGTGIDITDNVISASGGSGPTVVQTTGNSQTDVMSQDATTKMVFHDPSSRNQIKIGKDSSTYTFSDNSVYIGNDAHGTGYNCVSIGSSSEIGSSNGAISIGSSAISSSTGTISVGQQSQATSNYCAAYGYQAKAESAWRNLALGSQANAKGEGSIALGSNSLATRQGEMNIGTSITASGYNNTNYRLISGVHDGQSAHDAATVAQGNTLATTAPTTSTVGVLGQLYTDTTNMHTYQCTAISGDTYTWTQRW